MADPDIDAAALATGLPKKTVREIVRLYTRERTLKQVAESTEVPIARVTQALEAAGVPRRPRGNTSSIDWAAQPWTSKTFTEIAELTGMTKQAVSKAAARLGIQPYVPPPEIETPPHDAPLRKIVGWRLRQHRVRHGWTLERLAQLVGPAWTAGTVENVETARTGPDGLSIRGQRGLTLPNVASFAAALGVSWADLLLLPGQTSLARAPRGKPEGANIREICGSNVSRWREFRGWSLRELADLVEGTWTATSVAHVESGGDEAGQRRLTIPTLGLFAQALSVDGSVVTPADLARVPRQPPLKIVEGNTP